MEISRPLPASDFDCLRALVTASGFRLRYDASNEGVIFRDRCVLKDRIVVFPSSLEEAVYDVSPSAFNDMNLEGFVQEVLGGSEASHIFSADCHREGKVFWIEHPNSSINERAVRLTGVCGIRGDSIFICIKVLSKKRKASESQNVQFHSGPSFASFLNPNSNKVQSRQIMEAQLPSSLNDLPPVVLLLIFSKLKNFNDLSSCSTVCHSWRKLLEEDTDIFKNLPIKRSGRTSPKETAQTFHNLPIKVQRKLPQKKKAYNIPFVLLQAAKTGNANAAFLLAEELQKQGSHVSALDWFKKAARNGHQLSQFKVGEALYRGENGLCRDEEEALAWLSRAFKNPAAEQSICASSALLIGYMYMDGEGTAKVDYTEAVKWLKLATEHGSMDAEKTLGWLYNTGQY